MARIDELRLLAKIARMYYEDGLTQRAIASRLELSQPSISRLLKRAEAEEIVRVIITPPSNSYAELESALQNVYQLKEAIVVDSHDDEERLLREIGSAAAFYVTNTVRPGEVIGISSWSETLLSMVNAMHPLSLGTHADVVQILGGVGNPSAEIHAAHLTRRLAQLVGGYGHFLTAPGVAGSESAHAAYLGDPYVRQALKLFEKVTLALVGIGVLEPSKLLASSGNVFSTAELRALEKRCVAGDICLRFFDDDGRPVETAATRRVISIRLEQLQRVRRTVGIAGGLRKWKAIRAALRGGWITVLITDRAVAEQLLADTGDLPLTDTRRLAAASPKAWPDHHQ